MKPKATQEEIAKVLSLSRNTVSKVFNNNPNVRAKTKKDVLRTAAELGYKFVDTNLLQQLEKNESERIVTALMIGGPGKDNFWAPVLEGMESETSANNIHMAVKFIAEENQQNLGDLLSSFGDSVMGLIVVGRLDSRYIHLFDSLDILKILVSAPMHLTRLMWPGDIITNENESSIFEITRNLIQSGRKKIGFIGNIDWSASYLERYEGFRAAMEMEGLAVDSGHCLLGTQADRFEPVADMHAALSAVPDFPDAYICACDKTAYEVIGALAKMGKEIPGDIAVAAFDNLEQSGILHPTLTTVEMPTREMGKRAVEELLWRIKNPSRAYETIRLSTKVIYRESTAPASKKH